MVQSGGNTNRIVAHILPWLKRRLAENAAKGSERSTQILARMRAQWMESMHNLSAKAGSGLSCSARYHDPKAKAHSDNCLKMHLAQSLNVPTRLITY
eukprot:6465407-Amphidinium_carterae.1